MIVVFLWLRCLQENIILLYIAREIVIDDTLTMQSFLVRL